jgi:hypothetical protein
MKICLVGAELFLADGRTDGQTDLMKPIVAFRNFANTPTTQRTKRHRSREVGIYLKNHPTFLETEMKIFYNNVCTVKIEVVN